MEGVIAIKSREIIKSTIVDLLLLGVIFYMPALSHIVSYPLYVFEPMRLVLFASVLLTRNKSNSFVLAATIPLFSYFVGGHPVLVKSVIMGIELLVNMALFWLLLKKGVNAFYAAFTSIVVSKVLYYGMKVLLVNWGWMQMNVISTPVLIQFGVSFIIALIMFLILKNDKQ